MDIEDKEGTETSLEGMGQVQEKAALSVEGIPGRAVITSFAGLRAHISTPPYGAEEGWVEDFVIQEVKASLMWREWSRRDFPAPLQQEPMWRIW